MILLHKVVKGTLASTTTVIRASKDGDTEQDATVIEQIMTSRTPNLNEQPSNARCQEHW